MIESRYWKEDLLKNAQIIQPVENPPRWSEKSMVNFEKRIIISFFLIRKLFETYKVSQKSRLYKARIFCHKSRAKKITTKDHFVIDEVYDLNNEREVRKCIPFVANQLIHSCTIFAYREEDRNWGGVYACSDFERDNVIFRIPISEIVKILRLVGNDYPSKMKITWCGEKGDYRVETN